MINANPGWQKLAVFWQKNRDSGRFLCLKNTVKYDRRFFLNGENGAFCRPGHPGKRPFLSCFQYVSAHFLTFVQNFASIYSMERSIPAGSNRPFLSSFPEQYMHFVYSRPNPVASPGCLYPAHIGAGAPSKPVAGNRTSGLGIAVLRSRRRAPMERQRLECRLRLGPGTSPPP